jgi:hypothetical protein
MTLKTPQAVFGGLSMIAIAIYFGPGSQSIQAHDNDGQFWLESRFGTLERKIQENNDAIFENKSEISSYKIRHMGKTQENYDAIRENKHEMDSHKIKHMEEDAHRHLENFVEDYKKKYKK